jgi:hypothetical protein
MRVASYSCYLIFLFVDGKGKSPDFKIAECEITSRLVAEQRKGTTIHYFGKSALEIE